MKEMRTFLKGTYKNRAEIAYIYMITNTKKYEYNKCAQLKKILVDSISFRVHFSTFWNLVFNCSARKFSVASNCFWNYYVHFRNSGIVYFY